VGLTLTPEECSAEILKVLFGYLPEALRDGGDTGSVITVPAAFNQMQRDATLTAAEQAGIGKVALMQEPVAAVMSIMRHRRGDGVFLVYDLGGGTLDIAVAESISGRVNLLAHGGIAMCGGRDFDRLLLDEVVVPWLRATFDLPADLAADARYRVLLRMATWAAEKAKIDLSSREETVIALSEAELGLRDLAGQELYLDVPLPRTRLDELIAAKIDESIAAARETMAKAGLGAPDIERVVFVGGPTHYKPLRDRVARALGVAASTDVNPMTAVAEGAALFAESIEWSSATRGRKSARGTVSAAGTLGLVFHYSARSQDARARIVARVTGAPASGMEFQVDSLDSGWSSGRVALKDGAALDVPLAALGENTFKIFVFDAAGGPLTLEQNRLVITRTTATIDAIPSSSAIGVEVLDRLGGRAVLEYLVKEGDPLPRKGQVRFKAAESLRAGGDGALNFKVWEGDIEDPVSDNRLIGLFSIDGRDFDQGAIAAGAELVCDYQVLDSGNIVLEVTVPSIGGTFQSGRNFYSRQAGEIDYTSAAAHIRAEAEAVRARLDAVAGQVDDPRLRQARDRLARADALESERSDPEASKQALDGVLEARKLLARVRKDHLEKIRQLELDRCLEFFETRVRQHARPSEITSFEMLARTAQRTIEGGGSDFERHLVQLRQRNFDVLWRQDWFVVDWFERAAAAPHLFHDKRRRAELVAAGREAIKADDIARLRRICYELETVKISDSTEGDMFAIANIVRG
jgi:molecular chaperone DnaK